MEKSRREKLRFVSVFALWSLSVLLTIQPAWSATSSKADVIIDTEPGKPISLIVNKLGKIKSSFGDQMGSYC